jgi:hypothetical protein
MLQVICGIIQLFILILGKKFSNDTARKEENKVNVKEAFEAIDSGDLSVINNAIVKLRR